MKAGSAEINVVFAVDLIPLFANQEDTLHEHISNYII